MKRKKVKPSFTETPNLNLATVNSPSLSLPKEIRIPEFVVYQEIKNIYSNGKVSTEIVNHPRTSYTQY